MEFQHHGAKATAQLLGSQIIDDEALQCLLMAIQAVITSPTKEVGSSHVVAMNEIKLPL